MEIDKQVENLISRISFLTKEEKEFLISKLPNLDSLKKKKLFDFLILEEAKIFTIQIKHGSIFKEVYKKWEDIFNKISDLI
jgi:hypothetical protein